MNSGNVTLAQRYYGTSQVEPRGQGLTAGAWSALLIDGALRDIRYSGIEVIRAIAYLVRDKDWGTCRPVTRDMMIDESTEGFRVSYIAECLNQEGHRLTYTVAIDCNANGALEFRARAVAQTDFLTARCGFCVLHPIDGVAGAPARVEHGDGTIEESAFPELIDPWQPFKDIRAIENTFASGLTLRCSLFGEVFEMEDQRNWSDASFKTYSRPLDLPWPYKLAAGSTSEQAVRLDIKGSWAGSREAAWAKRADCEVQIDLRGTGEPTFALGIAIAPDEIDAALLSLSQLTELAPQQLTLHFDPIAGHGPADMARFAEFQRLAGIPAVLEYALPGIDKPERELAAIASQIRNAGLELTGIVVSPAVHRQSNPPGSPCPPCPPLDEVYHAARHAFPALRLGGGMLSYFTELNRKRPPLELVDWVTHATCPIVHAADDRSVMQTLEAVSHITRSCRAIFGARPYAIGPLSIAMRQNPYGSRVMSNPQSERVVMTGDDPRQRGLFGAAWLAGYAAALDGARLERLTLGGLAGPRGLVDASIQPARYPIFHVAAAMARMAGASRLLCRSESPHEIACFGARSIDGRLRMIIANLTPEMRTVGLNVRGAQLSEGLGMATLDEQSVAQARPAEVHPWRAEQARDAPTLFTLRPYACVQIASGSTQFGQVFAP